MQQQSHQTLRTPTTPLVINNPEQFRINIRKRILKPKFKTADAPISHGALCNLERAVFNWTIKEARSRRVVVKWSSVLFKQIYTDHLRAVVSNLTPKWARAIVDGECAASNFPFMTHQELQPAKWNTLVHEQQLCKASQFIDTREADTDTFTCPRCYSTKCSHYLLQTRSSDEPMTAFVTCLKCGCAFRG